MELNDILGMAIKANASDVHIKAGLPPVYRIDGQLRPLPKAPRLSPEDIRKMAYAMMSELQRKKFEDSHEVDLSYGVKGMGRFRVNMFTQRGSISMVLRTIPFNVQTIEELMLPAVIKKLTNETRGLILVTGTTGSGKSTTLASMIDAINANHTAHIITIEDPIEFLHRDKKSIINQREIGVDTDTFANALKAALRQDPDVILVGEMRDYETIETALTAAETGHLVLSTLHTVDAQESINRIVGAFPPYQQRQIRLQLSAILKGVVSQRLVPRADGKGRVPAVEVMVSTARVRELIDDKEKTKLLRDTIQQGFDSYGMQTFDQSLMSLMHKKLISFDEALRQSSNPDDFKLKVSGISSSSDLSWDQFSGDNDGDEGENNDS
ncbi:type IV pilus twitching motility protein PilT [Desulfuromonas acetoxidans]|uniref:Twitching motility protein n=1 Tax=Desulfuromonas acetoxidans (strain DSM 684 / 11070) TaxID=281689 RepID=Q1K3C3_DESA6|nr:type IV pilus twitching motility protein PilT [Desulfuromonas acetoxidans]EAT17051.1 twitching motility protein [Desulfuromonas acetoxidans DSM 684]MBF0645139.1 type IV pilus twitching motility protein PilT [Desulfuromonas acetoxidans]NVD24057.1 type IV pilus twitching motility protein PilT [Desulfuromonas acetoxidans]NVE16353.1 type IV pilus twitching motility protein PilT [Desulfuromonas acetoxidans]